MTTRRKAPVLELRDATLRFGTRTLWKGLNLDVPPGEFLAVLGPNGAGKTSLLRILLGLAEPTSGTVTLLGGAPSRGRARVGYVPQQRAFDQTLPLRGRDLVRLGMDGARWGPRRLTPERHASVDAALADVHAEGYADAPVGLLSGGEQQRLRIAQALVSDPALLLCDEPLLSLDLHHQRTVVDLLDQRRRERGTAVVFVTHEINPILDAVDRVLYFAPGSWAVGTPDEVLTTESLSALYRTHVDVLRVRGRIVVIGAPDAPETGIGDTDHLHDHAEGRITR